MKKHIIIYAIFVLTLLVSFNCFAENNVTIKIDGNVVKSDVAPVIENDRVLVPVRSIFEYMGGKVFWDDTTKTVIIIKGNDVISMVINKTVVAVNEKIVTLDVPSRIINSRTMVPIRFISENFNMKVQWDSDTYTVNIFSEDKNDDTGHEGTLNGIFVSEQDSIVEIKISGVGNLEHSMFKLSNPNRYVYDFKNCKLNTSEESIITSNNSHIKSVRWSQFDETTCRVVVDMDKYYLYDYETDGKDAYIIFDGLPVDDKLPVVNSGKSIKEMADKYKSSDFSALSKKAVDKLVVIDPGHGGFDVGTIGVHNGKEIYEKDINMDICLALETMLKKCGVSFYMLREDDTYLGINERPEIANDKNAYFYLCVHNNASENESIKGVQIYYSEETASFENMTNEEVSKIYYDNIASLGLKKAGMVDNPRYIVIYKCDMPSIIVENAFLSNKDDLELLMDDEFKVKLAAALCESTIQMLNKSVENNKISSP